MLHKTFIKLFYKKDLLYELNGSFDTVYYENANSYERWILERDGFFERLCLIGLTDKEKYKVM